MRNATNIADWMSHWTNFNQQLYVQYLIAKQR
jgi:hypothetical protein